MPQGDAFDLGSQVTRATVTFLWNQSIVSIKMYQINSNRQLSDDFELISELISVFLARPSHGLVKVMSWVSSMPSAVKTAGRTLKFPDTEQILRAWPKAERSKQVDCGLILTHLDPS